MIGYCINILQKYLTSPDIRVSPSSVLLAYLFCRNVWTKQYFHTRRYFNKQTLTNDVAIGRLVRPLRNSYVKPICLGSTQKYNTNMWGAGWGMKNHNENSHETLRRARVRIIFVVGSSTLLNHRND